MTIAAIAAFWSRFIAALKDFVLLIFLKCGSRLYELAYIEYFCITVLF